MRAPILIILSAASLALGACGAENGDAENAVSAGGEACPESGIAVTDGWVRAARAGQPATAAYFSVCNGDADDELIAASFAGAQTTELHQTVTAADGTASMTPTSSIPLPSGETVTLKPGGTHIMLIGVGDAIASGDSVAITLEFANADPMEVTLEARDAISAAGHGDH